MCPPDPPHTLTWVQRPGGFADFPLCRSSHLVALGLLRGSAFLAGFPTWAWGLAKREYIFPGGFSSFVRGVLQLQSKNQGPAAADGGCPGHPVWSWSVRRPGYAPNIPPPLAGRALDFANQGNSIPE